MRGGRASLRRLRYVAWVALEEVDGCKGDGSGFRLMRHFGCARQVLLGYSLEVRVGQRINAAGAELAKVGANVVGRCEKELVCI